MVRNLRSGLLILRIINNDLLKHKGIVDECTTRSERFIIQLLTLWYCTSLQSGFITIAAHDRII